MNELVKALREIIKKEKTTVYSVAKAIGVDFSSLYKALKNGGNPGAKTIDSILNHLGYKIQFIKSKRRKEVKPIKIVKVKKGFNRGMI